MEINSADNLARLYGELFVLLQQEEKLRQETERKLEKAKGVIDPRTHIPQIGVKFSTNSKK